MKKKKKMISTISDILPDSLVRRTTTSKSAVEKKRKQVMYVEASKVSSRFAEIQRLNMSDAEFLCRIFNVPFERDRNLDRLAVTTKIFEILFNIFVTQSIKVVDVQKYVKLTRVK